MIPAGVDLSDLSAQLSQGNVAIEEHAEFARAQQSQLRQAIAEINSNSAELANQDTENTDTLTGDGKFGIALIDTPYDKAADLRDVAQELQLRTGVETVIVRTPQGGAAVSDSYSRADLEAAESAFAGVSTDVGLRNYIEALSSPNPSWLVFAVVIAAVIGTALILTWHAVAKSLHN
ncbi:membrane protein [Corynebacterium pseudodiphtheriticum 090104]|nr:membrane protein [Corynebacterium pseudodiphtheriticum 090104]